MRHNSIFRPFQSIIYLILFFSLSSILYSADYYIDTTFVMPDNIFISPISKMEYDSKSRLLIAGDNKKSYFKPDKKNDGEENEFFIPLIASEELYLEVFNSKYYGFCRLNQNGYLDTTFRLPFTKPMSVETYEILEDGSILLVCNFYRNNGLGFLESNGIIKIFENGQIDSSLNLLKENVLLYSEKNGKKGLSEINSIKEQIDGKILIAGSFKKFNSLEVNTSLIRVDKYGNFDSLFHNNYSKNAIKIERLDQIDIQNDGKIIVMGWGYIKNEYTNLLLRLNKNGQIDNSFNKNEVGFNTRARLFFFKILKEESILISGQFDSYNDSTCSSGLIQVNKDGSFNKDFKLAGSGFTYGNNSPGNVYSFHYVGDNSILVNYNASFFNERKTEGDFLILDSNGKFREIIDVRDEFFGSEIIFASKNIDTIYLAKKTHNRNVPPLIRIIREETKDNCIDIFYIFLIFTLLSLFLIFKFKKRK